MTLLNQEQHQYLTPEELVERFKGAVTLGTLANWRSRGEGPRATKIGSRVRYLLLDVLKWEAAQRWRDPMTGE